MIEVLSATEKAQSIPNIEQAKYNIDQLNIASIHYTPPSLYIRYITSLK